MRKIVLALASLCCMPLAMAQSASDAVTKERMERAKRDASNPLRIIIEASQVKRAKAADSAPAAPPAPGAAARSPAEPASKAVAERRPARTAEPTPAASAATVAATAPGATPATTPATTPTPTADLAARAVAAEAPAAASAARPAPEVATAPTEAARVADVPAAGGLAASAAAAAPNPGEPAAEVLAPLRLVRYIEPEIPVRIRGRLRPTNEVTVAFTVQPDGSVSKVGIRATTARALDPVVLDAVRQWRYDPVPEEREHVVQLVFNLTE